ncbi:DNA polymerase thumb domain-containing protein [Jeotgalibacillus proteolyticus]|uniref:Y-family DNA polymerase n=1 Tax=Jeotgalibacillus proteolyticus TaxID=2082395 RepID=UPI003CF79719
MDYSIYPKRVYACVDMKSFYASCAAVEMKLDPLTCYLAVVGNTEASGSVVLAASPMLKKDFNIKTGSRHYEIPRNAGIHIVNPNMRHFMQMSVEITKLYWRYVPPEFVHTYSVDESFLRLDKVESLWGSPEKIAQMIQNDMMKEYGLYCTIGIGPNPLMSKLALDLESKKAPSGIARWEYSDVQSKLWPVRPLSEMWGIGRRVEKRLNRMGIFTIGELANHRLDALEKEFGILGNQLYYHAWGIDLSDLSGASVTQKQVQVSYGKSQILMRDYKDPTEVKHVILEMCEDVAKRARDAKKAGRTISLGIGYSKDEGGGGFSREKSIEVPTNITQEIYAVCLLLFDEFYEKDRTVRQISITLSKIVSDSNMQLDLFNEKKAKQIQLGYVMDSIRNKYGSKALLRAVSYTPAGTAVHRSTLIGGHKA